MKFTSIVWRLFSSLTLIALLRTSAWGQADATHQTAASYTPGATITVTTTFTYSGALLSLLVRPRLPSGWTLVAGSVTGSGTPDLEFGEIVWVGALPPSPVQLLYAVQVPTDSTGQQQIHDEIEYQFLGMVNPATLDASPDPLTVNCSSCGTTRTLTVNSVDPGSGVTITLTPSDSNGNGSGATPLVLSYPYDAEVTLTAPGSAGGNMFQKWQKDGADLATTKSVTLTMDADHVLTVVYTNQVQWVPYVPTAAQTSLSVIKTNATWEAFVTIQFPDTCYAVADWGNVSAAGSVLTADAQVVHAVNVACGQIVTTVSHKYDLGPLGSGSYTLVFRASGTEVERQTFVVPPAPGTASATFAGVDGMTGGSWNGIYGGEGYVLASDSTNVPAYAHVAVSGAAAFTWTPLTSDPSALQKADGTGRQAACWAAGSSFTVQLNQPAGQTKRVALYCLDWDGGGGRTERVDILDTGTGQVLDSQTVTSFREGKYLVWLITGSVQIRITAQTMNAVVSGLFIDPPKPLGQAAFVGFDDTTGGSWMWGYGSEGYVLADDWMYPPDYAQVAFHEDAVPFSWTGWTADERALERTDGWGRQAAAWYSPTNFTVDLDLSPGRVSQIALYCVDWDSTNRAERVDLRDAGTDQLLDSEVATNFHNGRYLIWRVSGPVRIQVTTLAGNALVSGIFFDVPEASATFAGIDSATQGNWQGNYGADGYLVVNDATNRPAGLSVAGSGLLPFTWPDASGARALQRATSANTNDRIAACWFSPTNFSLSLRVSGAAPETVALYCLDWDGNGKRVQQVDVLDAASGRLLDSQVVSNFYGGKYLAWRIAGSVSIRVKALAGNPVVSGLFFDPGSASAWFVGADTTTQGNWKGAYGTEGYLVVNDATNYPSYAVVSSSGQSAYTWRGSTGDARALQKAAGTTGSDRIAACWYAGASFTIRLKMNGASPRRVALYCLDWDGGGRRAEQVDLLDSVSGRVLDTQTVSNFSGGEYLVWMVSGSADLRVTALAVNAVISGLFFGSPGGAPPLDQAAQLAQVAGQVVSDDGATTNGSAGTIGDVATTVGAAMPIRPWFASITRSADGQIVLQLEGEPGGVYRIEVSSDTLRWVPLATNRCATGTLRFIDTTAPEGTARFYRAVAP